MRIIPDIEKEIFSEICFFCLGGDPRIYASTQMQWKLVSTDWNKSTVYINFVLLIDYLNNSFWVRVRVFQQYFSHIVAVSFIGGVPREKN